MLMFPALAGKYYAGMKKEDFEAAPAGTLRLTCLKQKDIEFDFGSTRRYTWNMTGFEAVGDEADDCQHRTEHSRG